METVLIHENNVVTKSNNLIESSYKLTVNEQKIILIVASLVQKEDKDFKTYKITVQDIIEKMGLKDSKSAYEDMKKITLNLMKKVIVMNVPSEEDEGAFDTIQLNWFSSVKYLNKRGTIEARFDPTLKPYLLNLKERFTSYKLKNIVALKSFYSIRIYELLKQYQSIGERMITIKQLKDMLGIDKGSYEKYNNFKRKVIQVAYKEINENTDISFEFEEIKKGRKVDKIKFHIESKNKKIPKNSAFEEIATTKEATFDPFVFSLKQIIKEDLTDDELKAILEASKYDMATIIKKYEIAKSSTYDNLVGFLISAINKDYKEPIKQEKNNRFHNFEGRTSKYTKEELEEKVKRGVKSEV
ncbi:replication initiation protein [Inediibacterium massiliense]|uniref:replication initiation protein n=1 Tax=Inediibacterium massiliense TaxID=1658111 RepID=UPI0006B52E17|nr:replication initiation protein [Inediibacterium massiliense]